MSIREITESILKFIREQDENIPPQGDVTAKAQADDEAAADTIFKAPEEKEEGGLPPKDKEEGDEPEDSEDKQDAEKEAAEKEYLGSKGQDEFFYLFRKMTDAGELEDIVVVDANDEELMSAKATGYNLEDVKGFVLKAIQDLEMSMVAYEIVEEYLFPEPDKDKFAQDEHGDELGELDKQQGKNRVPAVAPAGSAVSTQGERIPPQEGAFESKRSITHIRLKRIGENIEGVSTFIYVNGKGAGEWAKTNADRYGLDFEDPSEYSVTLIGADEIQDLPDLLSVLADERFVTDVVEESEITHFDLPHGEASETVKKVGSKYRVVSKKGRNLGTYDSKKEAQKRLRQVEFFKHNEGYGKFQTSTSDKSGQPANAKAAWNAMKKSAKRNKQTNA